MGSICAKGGADEVAESAAGGAAVTPAEVKAAAQKHKQIEKALTADRKKDACVFRMVALGAGECGKTTLLRHMALMNGKKFDASELTSFRHIIQGIVCTYIDSIMAGIKELGEHEKLDGFDDVFKTVTDSDEQLTFDEMKRKGELFKPLWKGSPVLRNAYVDKNDKLEMPEHVDYFFDRLDAIFEEGYEPSNEDILRIRAQTTGVSETVLDAGSGETLVFIDVGGQRSERKKWLNVFSDVSAVLFVSSLSDYDQVCMEDSITPRWDESLTVWKDVCGNKLLKKASILLFLNKVDMLDRKLVTRPYDQFVKEYTGNGTRDDVVRFVRRTYLQAHKECTRKSGAVEREIYVHAVSAINPNNAKKVLGIAREVASKSSLAMSELM